MHSDLQVLSGLLFLRRRNRSCVAPCRPCSSMTLSPSSLTNSPRRGGAGDRRSFGPAAEADAPGRHDDRPTDQDGIARHRREELPLRRLCGSWGEIILPPPPKGNGRPPVGATKPPLVKI